jgi:AcrR family transcriptional regulator
VTPAKVRSLRADARLNQDRLIQVAAIAFARDGADTSLKGIAKGAGVGIATLYRRFPTRELLIEAVYRNETVRLCASALTLLETEPPLPALRSWMDQFLDYMWTKHGMSSALRAALVADDDVMYTRRLLADAITTLIAAGMADNSIRNDVASYDVLMALGGITLIAGEPGQRELGSRLLNLLIDGLRRHADPSEAALPTGLALLSWLTRQPSKPSSTRGRPH